MARVKSSADVDKESDASYQQGVKLTYTINDTLWAKVDKSVPKNSTAFLKFVQKYRDMNMSKLTSPYPCKHLIWRPDCNRIVYDTLGITEDELYDLTSKIELKDGYKDPYLTKGHGVTTMIVQFGLFMLYRYFALNKKEKYLEVMKYYIGYFFYFSTFTKYFIHEPDERIMAYTIENMSFKNQIKQAKSVDRWIYIMSNAACEKYHDIIVRGADQDYYLTIRRTLTKFNDSMQNLMSAFMANHDNKNMIFDSKTFGEEGEILEQSSISADINQLAEKYTNKFFSNPNSEEVIAYVCNKKAKGGYIPERDLRNTIFMISDDKTNLDDVRSFYQAAFSLFFNGNADKKYTAKDVNTMQFLAEMQKLYKAGNSVDQNRIDIAKITDKWLNTGSKAYRSTNREATKSTYKKSIFDYFIVKAMLDK